MQYLTITPWERGTAWIPQIGSDIMVGIESGKSRQKE